MNKLLGLETEHLSIGSLFGNHREGGSFTGVFVRKVRLCFIRRSCSLGLEICWRRLWEWASLAIGALLANLEQGDHLPGTMRDVWRRALETEQLWKLCKGNLQGGGSFTEDPEGYVKKLLKWASLSIGTPVGDNGGDAAWPVSLRERWDSVLSGDLVDQGIRKRCKRRLWKPSSLPQEPHWGSCKGAHFTKSIERQKNSSGNGASLSMGVLWGIPGGRVPLLGTLKDLLKGRLWIQISLHRGHVGEPGGGFFAGDSDTVKESFCVILSMQCEWLQHLSTNKSTYYTNIYISPYLFLNVIWSPSSDRSQLNSLKFTAINQSLRCYACECTDYVKTYII